MKTCHLPNPKRSGLFPLLVLVSSVITLPCLSTSASAQVATNITPSGLATNVAPPNGPVTDITGGTRPKTTQGIPGPNLFHSFGEFHVGAGDVANFLNDRGLPTQNILSRVTGGNPSNIFGRIQTTDFQEANLFLINPQGIVFGPNASLDIGGAFYASTANRVMLEDGRVFTAIPGSEDALLTAASPEAFHFLGNTSPVLAPDAEAAILVQGFESLQGSGVSFIGREATANQHTVEGVTIRNGTVQTPNGAVNIVSIGGPQAADVAHVSVDKTTLDASGINAQDGPTQDSPSLGGIAINQGATIVTSGTRGGIITIRGGDLTIEDANIAANITDISANDSMIVAGRGIDIDVTNGVSITKSARLETNVTETAPQGVESGGIRIDAGHVEILGDPEAAIEDRTGIRSEVLPNSPGDQSGDIHITTGSARMRGAVLQTSGNGSADGGSIILNVGDDLILEESALLQSQTFGLGKAGDIDIIVQDGQIINRGNITAQSVAVAGGGGGGNISITVGKEILSGGITTFEGGDILLDERGGISTFLAQGGQGGNIDIKAKNLDLRDSGRVDVQSFFSPISDQTTGSLTIDLTGNLNMRGAGSGIGEQSEITVISRGGSPSGGATITAQEVNIGAFSTISTQSQNEGRGGDLTISADTLRVADGGSITSSSGNPFFIAGFAPPSASIGDAGDIALDVNGPLVISNGGEIQASTSSDGNGGTINIVADQVSLAGGSTISANSTSRKPEAGTAGSIDVTANGTIQVSDSSLSTNAANALGGNIELTAGDLIYITNSDVTTQVLEGSATAGEIDIDPDYVIIQRSNILSTAVFGDGGPITITANAAILVDPTSVLDASSQFGGAGIINIQAPIQELSGTIVPLPAKITNVTSLYGEACASQKNGRFSSFVKTTDSALSPMPRGLLTSPLAFDIEGSSQPASRHAKTSATSSRLTHDSPEMTGFPIWKIKTGTLPILPFQVCARTEDYSQSH